MTEAINPPAQIYCVSEHKNVLAGPCKIGVAASAAKRLANLQSGNWRPLHIVWTIDVSHRDIALETERRALIWFRPSWFTHTDEELSYLQLKSEWVSASPSEVFAYVREQIDFYDYKEKAA